MSNGRPHIAIMVGGLDALVYLPAVLTQQLGNFRRNDIDVTLLNEQSGANSATALLAGDVQAVIGFYDHTIDLQATGKCVKSVVQLANIPGVVELVAGDKAKSITSPADFRGQRLGVTALGSSSDLITQALAGQAGLHTADYSRVKVGTGQTFIAAMNHSGIDAGMTTDPTVALLVTRGQAKILVDMRTEAGTRAALHGLYPSTSLYMRCETVQHHPEIVQKLATSLVQTLQWIRTHSPQQIAAIMPAQFAQASNGLYVRAIADSIGMFNADGLMKREAADNALDILGEYSPKVHRVRDRIDLSATYTTAFVEQALRELAVR
ncbi:MAG: ABC transporter substrate-binding protein [Mycobacteriaceae bacterium]|nr:ABC transporter substrate-binding protein [Mycobacteriaceae bacterium]